jgi:hypothetical protein
VFYEELMPPSCSGQRHKEGSMNERNSDFEVEAARRSGDAQTGTPTTYIPPEVRPDPPAQTPYNGTGYSGTGAPTQPQPEPARWDQPAQSGAAPQWAPPPPPQEQPSRAYAPVAPVREHRRSGPPIVGPILLIGAGVLFLLNNLGIVDWAIWNDLWRLWPIVLIAIGLDLLVGRRNPLVSLIIVVLVLLAGGAVLFATGGFRGVGNPAQANLNVPLAGAQSARVDIDYGMGNLSLDGAAPGGALATGTLAYYENRGAPRQDVNTSGDSVNLTLEQRNNGFGNWFGGNSGNLDWNLHLSPAVPLDLRADLGAGNSELDLTRLNVQNLVVDSGAGNTTVALPEKPGRMTAEIDGGVGNVTLRVPDGVQARINVDSGIGNVDVDSRFTKQGDNYVTSGYDSATDRIDVALDMGVGNVKVSR